MTIIGYQPQKDELLQVSFNVGEETIEIVGSVVRVEQKDDVTAEVALEFIVIDPAAARLLEEELEHASDL